MFDGLTIGGAISGLKTAGEIAKGFLSLRDAAMIQEKAIELNAVILSAQASALAAQKEQFALLEEVGQLKKRIVELEGKGGETERYKRTDMGGGAFAYTLKDGVKEGEADHTACAKCYEEGHVSTLQKGGKFRGQTLVRCPRCKSSFRFGEPEPTPPNDGPSWGRLARSRGGR